MRGPKRVLLESVEGAAKIEDWEADQGTLEETRQILKELEGRMEGSPKRQGRIPATRRILKEPGEESMMGGLMRQGEEFGRCRSEAR
jgi:hypothetical protein